MKKLKSILDSAKSWAELLKWYIVSALAIIAVFLKLWHWMAIKVSLDVRLLVGIAITVLLGFGALLWRLWQQRSVTARADALEEPAVEQQRRPEIEERLLSILWKHKKIQVPFFVRLMPETAPTLEYHLERLDKDHLIYRTGVEWTINSTGKDYVVKHGLMNLVDTGRGRGANGSLGSHKLAATGTDPGLVPPMTDSVRRKVRMLIDRMEGEKKRSPEGSAARTTMDHTQADLEAIDADLKQLNSPAQSVASSSIKYGLTWNSQNEPVCSQCGKPLSFHDDRSLRCFTCNRDFAPNEGGRAMTVAEALRLQNGAVAT